MANYLYHYTSIEALACILKNHTLRFTSIDQMDDRQEKEGADLSNLGQFCFVSSWTMDEEESIPMWNMYASLEAGVRIKLRKNPFKYYSYEIDKQLENIVCVQEGLGQTLIPINTMRERGFLSINTVNDQILHEIEYTNDKNKLYPHFLKEDNGQVQVVLGKLGKYKNLHWKFQNEWRYILLMVPFNWKKDLADSFMETAINIKSGRQAKMFKYYDMQIDEEAFIDMEILMSPRISIGNQIIVETLVGKYNPAASIKKSCLETLL